MFMDIFITFVGRYQKGVSYSNIAKAMNIIGATLAVFVIIVVLISYYATRS